MGDSDLLYVNFGLFNDTPINQPAHLAITRNTNIIENPSGMKGSIVRFTVDANWPLFVPFIPNPGAPLTTNISITFSYAGVFFQQFVEITADEAKNGVFDFGLFLNDLNIAAATAFVTMKAAFPAAPGTYPPFFALNAAQGLISMYVDDGWLDTAGTPNNIWFNTYLQDLLGLPANLRLAPPQAAGADYQIAVKSYAPILPPSPDRAGFPYALNGLAGNLINVTQEYVQLSEFSDVSTILFTTNKLPIVPELSAPRTGYQQNAMTQSNFVRTITDFVISRSDAKPRDNSFVYLPTAEYRRFSFSGNAPIREADIDAYYTTVDGVLHGLFLPPGGSMTLKLLIER